MEPNLFKIETYPKSQWLATKLNKLGPEVRIIRVQLVKPYPHNFY